MTPSTPIFEAVESVMDASRSQVRILMATFNQGRLSGSEPHGLNVDISRSDLIPLDLVPDDAQVVGTYQDQDAAHIVAMHALGSLLIQISGRGAAVNVTASTIERCDQLIATVRERVGDAADITSRQVRMWMVDPNGRTESPRRPIPALEWGEVETNYPTAVRSHLGRLMRVKPPIAGGRLIVFHGEPGTGKTNAIRSLINEWAPWCSAHFIGEPERFFASVKHIEEVVYAHSMEKAATLDAPASMVDGWRLVIAEDTDELLRSATNHRSGGALGRLFNMADGILGQGAKALFLITTNERVQDLHPALMRPGRCLSRIEFERFDSDAARAWLPDELRARVNGPATLAELFELRGDHGRIQHQLDLPDPGGYL